MSAFFRSDCQKSFSPPLFRSPSRTGNYQFGILRSNSRNESKSPTKPGQNIWNRVAIHLSQSQRKLSLSPSQNIGSSKVTIVQKQQQVTNYSPVLPKKADPAAQPSSFKLQARHIPQLSGITRLSSKDLTKSNSLIFSNNPLQTNNQSTQPQLEYKESAKTRQQRETKKQTLPVTVSKQHLLPRNQLTQISVLKERSTICKKEQTLLQKIHEFRPASDSYARLDLSPIPVSIMNHSLHKQQSLKVMAKSVKSSTQQANHPSDYSSLNKRHSFKRYQIMQTDSQIRKRTRIQSSGDSKYVRKHEPLSQILAQSNKVLVREQPAERSRVHFFKTRALGRSPKSNNFFIDKGYSPSRNHPENNFFGGKGPSPNTRKQNEKSGKYQQFLDNSPYQYGYDRKRNYHPDDSNRQQIERIAKRIGVKPAGERYGNMDMLRQISQDRSKVGSFRFR